MMERIDWKDIPRNDGAVHGPLGTGTIIYEYQDTEDGLITKITYIRSAGDFFRDVDEFLEGNHNYSKRRRAEAFEQWSIDNIDQEVIEDFSEGFSPWMPQGSDNGHTVIEDKEPTSDGSEPNTNTESEEPDSVGVMLWYNDPETGNSSYPVVKAHKKDTAGGVINGKGYGKYDGAKISPKYTKKGE